MQEGSSPMLGCSTLYNFTSSSAGRKAKLRRLDRAVIFFMIAATYTPFAGIALGGIIGGVLLACVWTAAGIGAAQALLGRHNGRERTAVLLYLSLGWCGVILFGPLSAAIPIKALALLAVGGVLYSFGTAFHLAIRLRYHNAVWHTFVLLGAACHFMAVLQVAELSV